MASAEIRLDNGVLVGNDHPLLLIAGPCVIESAQMCVDVAGRLKDITSRLGIPYVFKASFDKANRSSVTSYRGPGLAVGLKILETVREQAGVAALTDFHEPAQAQEVASVVDVLQVPAFLCRQTDLLLAAAETGKVINVKKGQFMAPWDMLNVVNKLAEGGCERVIVTERGASFGYNNLVVDFRGIMYFREQRWPTCFDATHSVQLPGGAGTASSGQRQYVAGLSQAAVSLGIAALFWEVHPCPDEALCDGPNQLFLEQVEPLLTRLVELDSWAKRK
ncbi:3-deoxy-8-phosphooctulonate synthase [bacterium]|nr:3-deoxy-8-phosphooctulonate synthase [bacterium]